MCSTSKCRHLITNHVKWSWTFLNDTKHTHRKRHMFRILFSFLFSSARAQINLIYFIILTSYTWPSCAHQFYCLKMLVDCVKVSHRISLTCLSMWCVVWITEIIQYNPVSLIFCQQKRKRESQCIIPLNDELEKPIKI